MTRTSNTYNREPLPAPRATTVFVGLSGGVDSSVAAALLRERGFNVVGIHIKMWAPSVGDESWVMGHVGAGARATESTPVTNNSITHDAPLDGKYDGVCRQQFQDRLDAMRVAAVLDIPFRTWDLSRAYRAAVVDHLIREYAAGRTPNPDVMCNREIKFGAFLRRAISEGADFVATGHYVRKSEFRNSNFETNSKRKTRSLEFRLSRARDVNKDQSYFLWTLGQEELSRTLFPIGEFMKLEVRALARKFGLPTAAKSDSQGICFIGEFDLRGFLKQHITSECGKVLTASGQVVGEHEGAAFYTIGQRHGIGTGGRPVLPGDPRPAPSGAGGIPYYVTEKNVAANTLTVAEGPYDASLFRSELVAHSPRWVAERAPAMPFTCEARIRYRQLLQECSVGRVEGSNHDPHSTLHVRFTEPQRAVTPGQSIVFYRGEVMLGGAIIA